MTRLLLEIRRRARREGVFVHSGRGGVHHRGSVASHAAASWLGNRVCGKKKVFSLCFFFWSPFVKTFKSLWLLYRLLCALKKKKKKKAEDNEVPNNWRVQYWTRLSFFYLLLNCVLAFIFLGINTVVRLYVVISAHKKKRKTNISMSGLFTIRRRKRLKSEGHILLCLESLVKCFPPFFLLKENEND